MKKLSPQSRAAIDRLATGLLTIPAADRIAAERLIFVESWRDFRAKHPDAPNHEIANATFAWMSALHDRLTEMIGHGAGGEGHA
jgi:hypothetical protein